MLKKENNNLSLLDDKDDLSDFDEKVFDLVVVGTGLPECIVAAAAAQTGKSVLHVDMRHYYGGAWAALTVNDIRDSIAGGDNDDTEETLSKGLRKKSIVIDVNKYQTYRVKQEPDLKGFRERWASQDALTLLSPHSHGKCFVIDRNPRVMLSRGKFTETMVRCGVSKYQHFVPIDRVRLWVNGDGVGRFENVPCTKNDAFNCAMLTLAQRRSLMQFITEVCPAKSRKGGIEEPDDDDKFLENVPENQSFFEYLESLKLDNFISNLIVYVLALAETDQLPSSNSEWKMSAREGMRRVKTTLKSHEKNGNTPFLCSVFGSGEFPQAFARLCAELGGSYLLEYPLQHFCVKDDKVEALLDSHGTHIHAKQILICGDVVAKYDETPEKQDDTVIEPNVSNLFALDRWVGICTQNLCSQGDKVSAHADETALMVIPPNTFGNPHSIHIIQFSPKTETCSKGFYLVHMSTHRSNSASPYDWNLLLDSLFEPFTSHTARQVEQQAVALSMKKERKGDGQEDDEDDEEEYLPKPHQKSLLVWCCTFHEFQAPPISHMKPSDYHETHSNLTNVVRAKAPPAGVLVDDAISISEYLFKSMFPEQEFLPQRGEVKEEVDETEKKTE